VCGASLDQATRPRGASHRHPPSWLSPVHSPTRVVYRVVFVIGCVSCNKFSHFRQNVTISTNRPLYPPPFSSTYLRASLRLSARPTRAPNPPRKRRASDTYFSRTDNFTILRLYGFFSRQGARAPNPKPASGAKREERAPRHRRSPSCAMYPRAGMNRARRMPPA
jgi:hypothetical protein